MENDTNNINEKYFKKQYILAMIAILVIVAIFIVIVISIKINKRNKRDACSIHVEQIIGWANQIATNINTEIEIKDDKKDTIETTIEITTECILTNTTQSTIIEEVTSEPEPSAETITTQLQTQSNTTEYSNDDFNTICMVVEAETHGGDSESKIHIVSVILNRVNSPDFPNTIQGVCYQSGQFASRSDVEQSTIDAVNAALISGDTVQGALFFCTCSGCWADTNREYLFTDNIGHRFYR